MDGLWFVGWGFARTMSILAYYALSQMAKKEGIRMLKSWPVFMMLAATIFSAMTTVYDKFIVHNLGLPIYSIQAYSAFHRCALAILPFLVLSWKQQRILPLRWSIHVPLVGLSWVGAELIYFFAIADQVANVTYLSIFRRASLVVGFFLSVLLIGERDVLAKSAIIGLIIASTAVLIMQRWRDGDPDGPLNSVVFIWAYDDFGHRIGQRAELGRDADWQAFVLKNPLFRVQGTTVEPRQG